MQSLNSLRGVTKQNFWDNRKKISPKIHTHKSSKLSCLRKSAINDAVLCRTLRPFLVVLRL